LTPSAPTISRSCVAARTSRPKRERASGLHGAALLAIPQGDYAAGKRLLQESLALYREIDDPKGAARVLGCLAWLSKEQGHYPEAEALAREAVDCARATADHWLLSFSLGNLATALHRQGDWAAARELHEQALVVAREFGPPWVVGDGLNAIGQEECDEGRHDLALKHLAEGMAIAHGLGHRPGVTQSLEGLAGVAAAPAAPRRAARLWGAADALRQQIGNARSVHESIAYEREAKPVRAILTAEAFDQAWDEGRAMTPDDAVRYALNEQSRRDT